MKKNGIKLKNKFIFGIFIIAIILGYILVFLFYNSTLQTLSKINLRELITNTENTAATVKDLFALEIHSANVMSQVGDFRTFLLTGDKNLEQKVIDQLNSFKEKGNYFGASIVSATGTILLTTDESSTGLNVSQRDYFKISSEGKPAVMMAFGLVSQKPRYYFASPIKDNNGIFLGAVVVVMESFEVDELINKLSKVGEKIMLTDSEGVILSSNIQSRVYNSLGKFSVEKLNSIKIKRVYLDTAIKPLEYDLVLNKLLNYTGVSTVAFYDEDDREHETFVIAKVDETPFFFSKRV